MSEITLQVVSDETYEEENRTPEGWHQLFNGEGFVKWQYANSPYRVIAHFREERGHHEAIFTSTFHESETHLIKGNLGKGVTGLTKATIEAQKFMRKYDNGCPPPNEMN